MDEREIRKQIKNGEIIQWYTVSIYGNLSEKFMREYLHELNLPLIIEYQKLSLQFIKDYIDLFGGYWYLIFSHQVLPIEFLEEYKNHPDFIGLTFNKKTPLLTQLYFYKDYRRENFRFAPMGDLISDMREIYVNKTLTLEEVEAYIMMQQLSV